ncbi:helix-turn-helix domain-containing protein [Chryseobacterium shandongense]|uniref:Helix-turn-helix domain-containing protein n=1 Tax=Chryseobacterium shandongense TaxID=1493872 RepID=A0ABN5RZA8_9FLAO|nr:helix-turn-helix domain-containing protein [Chryseobacterium shandongense]AZA94888.1 helix-turn-helix domain-containing protein [Chryseobacterium shandongense]
MNTMTNTIDWTSPDVLSQIVHNIKNPLETIITASKQNERPVHEIIFNSSKQINSLIEELLTEIKSKSVSLTFHERPDIFGIYEANENVQCMCAKKINPSKITKLDQNWLLNLEKEIYRSINQNDINIYDLAYKMAVSERQLHRKINSLLYLSPNKYIRILRLHKAKELIDNYIQNSISQVAYAVGYNDVHYFSKLFVAQYNMSPKELIHSLK